MKNVFLFLFALTLNLSASAQESALFGLSSLTSAQLSLEQQAFVTKVNTSYQPIGNTFVTIEDLAAISQDGTITLDLPNGQELIAQVFRVSETEENTLVWTGKIGDNGDFITIAQNAAGAGGMFTYEDRFYSFHPLDADNSLLLESPIEIHEDKICGIAEQLNTIAATEECEAGECEDPIVDVLLVWTDEAVAWLAGLGNPFIIAIYGALGMESVNIAFANSEVSGEVRYQSFRYSGFDYSFPPRIDVDVDRLTINSVIFNAREEFRADLVVMLTNQAYVNDFNTPVFGTVRDVGPGQNSAFAIVEIPFLLSPRWTLAHEIGHLLGARHNRFSNGGNDNTDICAHAWRFTGSSGNEQRTILALLGSQGGERILHYSNPDISFDGESTGTSDDDNAGRIDQVNCIAQDYLLPRALNVKISGSSDLCRCFPESYEEFRSYRADINVATPPLPGVPPFTYAWHWNTSGIFTPANPGNFLGDTERIDINFVPPCNSFFLHLSITSSDGVTATHIRRVNTSQCVECSFCTFRGIERRNTETSVIGKTECYISPNPAKGQLTIHFNLTQESSVQIRLTNISGKEVYQSTTVPHPKGNHTQHLTLKKLAPGLYFCSIHYQNSYKTLKLVLQ